MIDESNFQIRFKVNCRECGKKNAMCIEEPLGSPFLCRQCYSGLDGKGIAQKFRELAEIIGSKA
jgi:hypothetical protein